MIKPFKHTEALNVLKEGAKLVSWSGSRAADFGGRTPGTPTRKRIMEICKDYKYLKAEEYIEQTLAALADWHKVFTRLNVPNRAGEPIFNVLARLHQDFEK